jgi:preprotein translocase subunit Sec61beta
MAHLWRSHHDGHHKLSPSQDLAIGLLVAAVVVLLNAVMMWRIATATV